MDQTTRRCNGTLYALLAAQSSWVTEGWELAALTEYHELKDPGRPSVARDMSLCLAELPSDSMPCVKISFTS